MELSVQENEFTLHLPERYGTFLKRMLECEYAILSWGDFGGTSSIEILFEDKSDTPAALRVETDIPFPNSHIVTLSLFDPIGKRGSIKGYCRRSDTLPCMKPLEAI